MDNLSVLWEKLSLSDSEGRKYVVKDTLGENEYFIASRFFTRRVLSMEAISQTFKLQWRTMKGFEVRDMGNHRVLFVFLDEENVDQVIRGELWTFDKHLVVLKRV